MHESVVALICLSGMHAQLLAFLLLMPGVGSITILVLDACPGRGGPNGRQVCRSGWRIEQCPPQAGGRDPVPRGGHRYSSAARCNAAGWSGFNHLRDHNGRPWSVPFQFPPALGLSSEHSTNKLLSTLHCHPHQIGSQSGCPHSEYAGITSTKRPVLWADMTQQVQMINESMEKYTCRLRLCDMMFWCSVGSLV